MKMNRLGKCALLGIVLPLALSGAAQAQDVAPQNAPDASDVFEWKLQPPVGLRGRYTIFTRSKVSQNLPIVPARNGKPVSAMRSEAQSQQTIEVDYEAISRDDAGNTVSRLTYRTFKQNATMKMNGRVLKLPNPTQMPDLQKVFKDVEIDIKQAPNGRVLNVLGLDVLQRRFKSAFASQDAATIAAVKPFIDSVFSEKMLRQSWDASATRPKTPLSVGQSWDYTIPLAITSMNIELRGTRTLIALSNDRATVADRANIILKTTAPLPFSNTAQVKISGGGILDGNSIVNRETGLEIESHTNQRWATHIALKTVEKGRTTNIEIPQWMVIQTRQVFRPTGIESKE